MSTSQPYRKMLALSFSITIILLMPASLNIVPTARADTTVCNKTQTNWFASTRDFWFHAVLRTCGTGTVGATTFTSTSHNVTLYCSTTFNGPQDVDCLDIRVQSWRLEFLGQANLATSYNHTTTATNSPNPPEYLDEYQTYTSSVDFARTYVKLKFLDDPPGSQVFGPFTLEAQSFVGTYPVFRIDWSDYDNNGTVNNADVNNATAHYDHPDAYWDYNANGKVDITDTAIVAYYYGKTFSIPNFPGKGCAAQTFNNPTCQPTDATLTALHPKWKDSCTIFPQPDQNYCNTHAS